jgi:hypothetical protein
MFELVDNMMALAYQTLPACVQVVCSHLSGAHNGSTLSRFYKTLKALFIHNHAGLSTESRVLVHKTPLVMS